VNNDRKRRTRKWTWPVWWNNAGLSEVAKGRLFRSSPRHTHFPETRHAPHCLSQITRSVSLNNEHCLGSGKRGNAKVSIPTGDMDYVRTVSVSFFTQVKEVGARSWWPTSGYWRTKVLFCEGRWLPTTRNIPEERRPQVKPRRKSGISYWRTAYARVTMIKRWAKRRYGL
jgi:hypothetical protein